MEEHNLPEVREKRVYVRTRKRDMYASFRVLAYLLYGNYESFFSRPNNTAVYIPSLSKLSRFLGLDTKRVKSHLIWLESQGYLRKVEFSANARSVMVTVEVPRVR